MKRVAVLSLALFAVIVCASAQEKGERSVGLSLNYGTDIESIGIGGHFNYNITDHIRLAPNFTYFMKNDNVNEWDLNLNAHYLIPLRNEKLMVYPIAGFIVTHWSASLDIDFGGKSFSVNETKVGFNLGGGVQYDLTRNFFINGEVKYSIVSDFDQAVISAGFGYKF